jgi:hypothetical protein
MESKFKDLARVDQEKMLRSLSVAANNVGRWAHIDPELSKLREKLWKVHERLKK